MKIGLCEKDLRGSLEENLSWMAENGFQGFQIWKQNMDKQGKKPQDVLNLSKELGLEISAIGGGPNLVDPKVKNESIDLFKSFLDLSVELGPKIVTAESKAKPDDLTDDDAWKSTVDTVSEICAYAETLGAALAIEAAGPCFIRDWEMYLELKEKVGSDALKVNYDPANIVWAEKDVVAGVQATGADFVHTHAKDVGRVIDDALGSEKEKLMDVPAGEGLVNYETYLKALKDIDYNGFLTIEMHAGAEGRHDDILKAKSNISKILEGLQ